MAAEIRLRAKRRVGEISKTLDKAPPGPKDTSHSRDVITKAEALKHAGVSKSEAHRCEQLASVDKREFEAFIADRNEVKEVVSSDQLLKQVTQGKPHVTHNSGENEWYTPTSITKAAADVMGGIDLDPASCEAANRAVGAECYYSLSDNGLTTDWFGRVWLNPPYKQPAVSQFCEKTIKELLNGNVSEAIVLTNNFTETEAGQKLLTMSDAVCFHAQRIKFIDTDGAESGAPLQGQMLVYVGPNKIKFVEIFSAFGVVLNGSTG